MDKVYHVFVSSTYSDLIEERKKVSEAIAKAGYVAEGMEIFPASSQRQMNFIEKVIDRCDYYILIIAGRYGSEAEGGLSYTEKEFQYAKSKGIPILAFIRKDIDDLSSEKKEKDPEKQQKLKQFTDSLAADTLVDFWLNPDELSAKALAALSQARVAHEGVGWIRADRAASVDILNEVNELRKTNAELTSKLAQNKGSPIFDDIKLAGLDEEFKIRAEYKDLHHRSNLSVSLEWRAILAAVGVEYRTPSNTSGLGAGLKRAFRNALNLSLDGDLYVNMEDKELILLQLEALGMMHAATYNLKNGGLAVLHQLTEKGLACMLRENVVKSNREN